MRCDAMRCDALVYTMITQPEKRRSILEDGMVWGMCSSLRNQDESYCRSMSILHEPVVDSDEAEEGVNTSRRRKTLPSPQTRQWYLSKGVGDSMPMSISTPRGTRRRPSEPCPVAQSRTIFSPKTSSVAAPRNGAASLCLARHLGAPLPHPSSLEEIASVCPSTPSTRSCRLAIGWAREKSAKPSVGPTLGVGGDVHDWRCCGQSA